MNWKEVIDRIPSAEMVRFANSGTEATMSAIRLARGFTGRDKCVTSSLIPIVNPRTGLSEARFSNTATI